MRDVKCVLTCRYSVGLARPRGSKPLSPGRDPSSHEGLSVLGSHSASAITHGHFSLCLLLPGLPKHLAVIHAAKVVRVINPQMHQRHIQQKAEAA